MSKTYRSWAEVEDWGLGREFRRPHKRKSNLEWKKEAEIEMANSGVFVIINEWVDLSGTMGMEIVDGGYFKSEEDALKRLGQLADDFDVDIRGDDTGFTINSRSTLEYEEYYIQELEAH